MATFNDIKTAIQTVADAIDNPGAYGLQTEGTKIEMSPEVTIITGESWGAENPIQIMFQGLANWMDATYKAKLNELIGEYNQLRTDYDNATVPTNANAVTPIP